MEDGSKTICREECLVKFKEVIRIYHIDITYPSLSLSSIKIKEEPIDEEYNQNLPPSVSTENIKDEPNVAKRHVSQFCFRQEDLKIGSVFSLTGDSTSAAPTLAHMDLPASCSNCKTVLMDGETVYQRKGHADIFCATSCLLKFYQIKPVKKTCQFCLQVLTQSQDVLQAPVDTEGTMKDFCSQTCLSSFNYKKIKSTKIPVVPLASHSQCSMCNRYCISKHEIIQQGVVHKVCSDPCFLRFCNMNKLPICENCHSRCSTQLMLKMEDGNKKLCSAECLAQFKKTPQPCAMCRTSNLMSDMVENKNSEDMVELFCTSSCVMASKIQAVSASGIPLNCDNCAKTTVPACHLAMSDASIRNFCTLTCAMAFKVTTYRLYREFHSLFSPDQTQSDFLKPPEKLPCAQCRRIIKTTPKVIQKKSKMNFVCSLACSQEFKRVNNIMGKCEYCKNERIIRDAKRVDNKDCYFCSDGCKMLFRHDLEREWGKHCRSCVYCQSISRTVVTAKYEGKDEEFCSEDCSSKYNMLFCRVANCDTCGRNGKLRQSLPMLGEVKHFCDLKCLLHFCNKKVQMVNTVSSPPRASSTAASGKTESSPVIANVISLASALAQQHILTPRYVSVPQASIQTDHKELKNKSMLCTPLVHNKGVSCTTQTVDTGAQTDTFVPKVITLPIPVPVYVPLPMNMYSQYTPQPVNLPLPLPVPMFLPVRLDSPEPTVKDVEERIQPEPTEENLISKSELETRQDDRNEREDGQKSREVTQDEERQETQALKARAVRLKEDILRCSAAELSDSLCRFINEVKQPDGESYSPDSLFYLCLSIQQFLFENGRMENIFSDLIYNKFSTEFTNILRGFKPSITASGYVQSRVEEEFLWDCKQLGAYSPIVLLNTLLFFCCKYFGFTSVEQHRQLSFAHVRRCTKTNPNNTMTTFLRFYPPISIDEAEPAKKRKKNESEEDFLEMMENTENPLRCPVRLYEFYLSKCSESVRQRRDLFYLRPEHRCVPSSPLWFSSTLLDDSTLEAMLVRTLTVRELQGKDRGLDTELSL
uniref:TRASH domain-containing protein n=1 Tax=Lates calcarifer TaxID=8187 RepID=A0A4W6DBP6_LATCA